MVDNFGALAVTLNIQSRESGPLAGKTFVAKENIDIVGETTTNGNPDFAASHAAAGANAPVVDRLLTAGARLVGKTQMDEMAYSLLGANHHFGTPINPAAAERHPGGSSSGSAVAVAASLADFALGTDTAGSCRAPAAFCGVYGFRPSHGALSSNGVIPLAPTLDTIGWFARDPEMMARVGDVLLPNDLDAAPLARIRYLAQTFSDAPTDFMALAKAARTALEKKIPIEEASLGDHFFTQALAHFRNLQAYEAWESHGDWITRRQPSFGLGIAERFAYAAHVTREQKQAADAFRERWRQPFDALLAGALLAIPTTPFPAPMLDESAQDLADKRFRMVRLFMIASFFGLPQISIPLKTDGAPLGLSFIGRRWSDRALLAFAREFNGAFEKRA
jgi:amidase